MTNACPLCATPLPTAFVKRSRSPAMQNALAPTKALARNAACGSLEFACCTNCGFVTNTAFDPALTAYDQNYENSQHHSPAFSSYLDGLVQRMAANAKRPVHVVEVGCGKGVFLTRLIAHLGHGSTGTGFDPAYEGPTLSEDGRITFIQRFYDASASATRADIVVCRHVIEHVADPMAMLRSVHAAVATNPHARIFFETPCADWILKKGVVWDFFYEHCSLFTRHSLSFAFSSAGFAVQGVEHIFGGQYILLEATPLGTPSNCSVSSYTQELSCHFGASSMRQQVSWENILDAQQKLGPVAVWGAGAKGVTLLNLLDPDAHHVLAVVDINPRKQQRFIPCTGHVCISPKDLDSFGIRTVLVTNPNYLDEIQAVLSSASPGCQAINLMEPTT
jgi:hypothetical protein